MIDVDPAERVALVIDAVLYHRPLQPVEEPSSHEFMDLIGLLGRAPVRRHDTRADYSDLVFSLGDWQVDVLVCTPALAQRRLWCERVNFLNRRRIGWLLTNRQRRQWMFGPASAALAHRVDEFRALLEPRVDAGQLDWHRRNCGCGGAA